jgi:hypothetical protein
MAGQCRNPVTRFGSITIRYRNCGVTQPTSSNHPLTRDCPWHSPDNPSNPKLNSAPCPLNSELSQTIPNGNNRQSTPAFHPEMNHRRRRRIRQVHNGKAPIRISLMHLTQAQPQCLLSPILRRMQHMVHQRLRHLIHSATFQPGLQPSRPIHIRSGRCGR